MTPADVREVADGCPDPGAAEMLRALANVAEAAKNFRERRREHTSFDAWLADDAKLGATLARLEALKP